MEKIKNSDQTTIPTSDSEYSMQTHMIYGKSISRKWDYSHHVVAPISSSVIFRLDSVERGGRRI